MEVGSQWAGSQRCRGSAVSRAFLCVQPGGSWHTADLLANARAWLRQNRDVQPCIITFLYPLDVFVVNNEVLD